MIPIVEVLGFLSVPVAIGNALLRYRLWDIDTVIRRTLVYGLLTGILGTLYAGLIIGLEALAGLFTGQVAQPVVVVVSTLAIAALFLPVRRRIQAFIDQRVYRRKFDAQKTLEAVSATLRTAVDVDDLRGQVLQVVQETMHPDRVSLWLRPLERPAQEEDRRRERRSAGLAGAIRTASDSEPKRGAGAEVGAGSTPTDVARGATRKKNARTLPATAFAEAVESGGGGSREPESGGRLGYGRSHGASYHPPGTACRQANATPRPPHGTGRLGAT
jgi:hypothetical protein